MFFERFVAKRYLISKKKIQFITIITFISIAGMAVGVAALIAVLSVFNGFSKYQINALTGFDPHIRFEPNGNNKFGNYQQIISKLNSDDAVKGYDAGIAPYVINKGVIASKKENVVVFVKGVDDKLINLVSNLGEETKIGEFKFNDNENYGGIVLGFNLAAKLGAKVNDTISVLSTAGMEQALTQIVQPKSLRFIVRGIYSASNRDYDKLYSFISLPYSQKLFEMNDEISGLDIRISNINDAQEYKEKLLKIFGNTYNINTWYDLHEDFYSIMKVERWTAYIVLILIIVVATFTITGSLTMTVIEKKRDIGILKALGSSNRSIVQIFMTEGILIGIVGTITGCLLGYAVCLLQINLKIFALDPFVYAIDALPIDLRYSDFIAVSVASLLLSLVASLYPAFKAAKEEPIEAIRWE